MSHLERDVCTTIVCVLHTPCNNNILTAFLLLVRKCIGQLPLLITHRPSSNSNQENRNTEQCKHFFGRVHGNVMINGQCRWQSYEFFF